jgi:hypothetical protein
MMGIVVAAMGSLVGYTGWQGRLATDKDVALKSQVAWITASLHRGCFCF